MRQALRGVSLPGAVVEWLAPDAGASPAYGRRALDDKATAYICVGPQCSAPVTDPTAIVAALRGGRPGMQG